MRKTLLQSFLLSVLMLLASPVWAQEIEDQVSFYFEDEVNPFIDDSRITSAIEYDETLGSNVLGWTCANNAYNGYSFSHFDFSGDLVNNTEEVEITFDYYNEKGSRSILSIGDAGVRGNTGGSSKQTYNSSGAFFRIGSDKNNAFICGTNYSQNDICDKWVHVNVIVNLVDKNIFWDVYVWDEETKTFSFHEAFNGDYYSEDGAVCSQIDVFGCMNNSHCCMIDNLEIKSKTGNYEHANYTIRYVDYEENELKPSRVAEGYVDHPVELLPSDTENFYSNDGTKKYIFDSIDAPDVASDGSTVVTVFFREAETYYAKLNCMSNDSYELLAQVTGSFFEGDNLTLYPSRGYGKDGKYYMTGATNWNGVTYTFPAALSPSVIDGKTTYTGILLYNEDASVAYYSDFERLALPIEDAGEGTGLGQLVGTVNSWWCFGGVGQYFDRFSQGRGIRLDAGSYVWTEPIAEDGTYMVRIYGRNDKSANCEQPYALGYRDAEGNVTLFDVPVPDWASATTGESVVGAAAVEADEEHDAVKAAGIGLKAGWSLVVKNTGNGSMISLDDVTLTKVADYAETPTIHEVSGEEAPELVAPKGWTSGITNGNLAGDDVSSFVMKEYPSVDIVPAAIVAGAGTDGSRGILVKAGDDTENKAAADWDSQFWIVLDDELPSGTKLHVEFDYKASQAAKAITMTHGNPGAYHHWAAIGDVNFTTEWQHFTTDIEVNDAMAKGDNGNGSGTGLKSICFCLQIEKSATDYCFDNFGVWYQKPVVIDDWTDIIVNGDMEGENNECFYVTEQGIGGPFLAQFTEGIGKDGSRAVKVESYDDPAQDWDTQFFIRLPYQLLPEGKFRISFDYKADKAGDFDTQSHTEPGGYITWACVGSGSFTTDWKHYEAEGTITADMSKEGQLFQTICFNLAKNKVRTNFIFDNVKFEIPTDYLATLTKNPAVDPKPYTKPVYNSMAIVGDFLGLEGDANWEPTNGWEMAQDAENPAVWTLTKGFVAEAKTYEYQAAANGKLDYVLPKDGKAGFNFDDPNLGAAAYDLTFTVDTRLHSLDLDVQKTVLTTYTATFTTDAAWTEVYAYAWSGEEPHVTKFLGDWPGTKLEAVDGVYTVSIVSKDAPEKIIFNNGNSGEGNQTADLDFVNGSAYEFKAASGVEAPELVAPEGWKNAITNGNLAGDDVSSFVMKEYPSVDIVPAAIVADAGTNGSRGILVKAGDDTENKEAASWDSQFWIVLDDELPSGTKLHVEFDYKASQAAKAETMSYGNPGVYQHWAAIGDVNFTTEWQHFTADVDVNDAMAKGDNGNGSGTGLKSIGFCLQIEKSATDYRFDNFGVWYQKPDEEIDDGTVKLPKGVEVVTYQMTYKDYDGKVNYAPVNVAVDGNDVYFQGMSEYFPEAWVKGTKDGNIILFPAMQFMGENELIGPSYYFYNGDAAFTYDAGTDTYSSEGEIYGILNESYYDGHIFNPVIKRVVDIAAVPANPEITNMMDTGYYGWRFDFNVPLEDVNGNPLVTSKLVYKIYSDTKGVIKALTFTPATHVKLTEDMTEIPYGFTDSWDFYSTQLYLNGLYSDEWDKIGIQSIYYGGGEVNATEIQWYDLRLVRAPEDLATQTYGFSGYDTYYSRDVTGEVQVGFYGEDEVYIQGLSKYLPEAWVKGKLVDGTLTIPQTYLGVYTDDDEWTDDSDVFFTGTTFFYNEEAGTFYSDGGYVTYESPEAEYYMDEFKYVLLTKLLDVAAIPANPEIINFNYLDTDYPILQFEIPTVDINGNSLIKSKLAYQIYYFKNNEVTTLVLTKDLYPELGEDKTEIPYGFKAGDIYPNAIYLNQIDQEIDSWQMIGIQSIYYGGYDRNISDIVWFTNDNADGIRSVDNAKMDNVPVYNLAGQRIDNSQFTIHNSQLKRGIYIVNGKKITVK